MRQCRYACTRESAVITALRLRASVRMSAFSIHSQSQLQAAIVMSNGCSLQGARLLPQTTILAFTYRCYSEFDSFVALLVIPEAMSSSR